MGERKADGISVKVRRKTIYFRDSEDISLALCHCHCENLQFTASHVWRYSISVNRCRLCPLQICFGIRVTGIHVTCPIYGSWASSNNESIPPIPHSLSILRYLVSCPSIKDGSRGIVGWILTSLLILCEYLLRPRERLRSIVMNSSVCLSVCLSVREDIPGTTHAIFTNFCACCLWTGVARSSSGRVTKSQG